MKTAITVRRCFAAIILSSAFATIALPVAIAADATPPAPSTEKKAPALPLTATFAKGTPGENGGPYAVTLKNTSPKALTVGATIIWSVTVHTRDKTSTLPPHEIVAGGTWTINDLAVEDRIILTAEGYGKLELKTPPGK